jgi:hypothetical protein
MCKTIKAIIVSKVREKFIYINIKGFVSIKSPTMRGHIQDESPEQNRKIEPIILDILRLPSTKG